MTSCVYLHFILFSKFAISVMLPTLHVGEVQLSIWNVNALALQALRHLLRKKVASLLPQLGVDVTANDADNDEKGTRLRVRKLSDIQTY